MKEWLIPTLIGVLLAQLLLIAGVSPFIGLCVFGGLIILSLILTVLSKIFE